jgi:hypothetical protein
MSANVPRSAASSCPARIAFSVSLRQLIASVGVGARRSSAYDPVRGSVTRAM